MNNTTQKLVSEVQNAPSAIAGQLRRWWLATHISLSMTGMLALTLVVALAALPDWRRAAEERVLGWLLSRQEAQISEVPLVMPDLTAIDRVTAASPSDLPSAQANVAMWLSRRYRVAPEPLSVLVSEAFHLGSTLKLDPTLILAVMAIESRFNPYAQSPVGAQGLMQVMTRVHTDKYQSFGGTLAAFDPVSNLRVGAQVLNDAVRKAGSVEGGLKLYVGAVTTDGSGYINKVMAEHLRLQSVAMGKPMPKSFPVYTPPVKEQAPEPAQPDQIEIEAEATGQPSLPPLDKPQAS